MDSPGPNARLQLETTQCNFAVLRAVLGAGVGKRLEGEDLSNLRSSCSETRLGTYGDIKRATCKLVSSANASVDARRFGSFVRKIPQSGWELRVLCSGISRAMVQGASGSSSDDHGPCLKLPVEGPSNLQPGSSANTITGTADDSPTSHLQARSSAMHAFLQAAGGRITASKLSMQVARAEPAPTQPGAQSLPNQAASLEPLSLADVRALLSCMGSLNSFAFNVHGSRTCKPMDAAAFLLEVATHTGARLQTLEVGCLCSEHLRQADVGQLVCSTMQRLEGLRILEVSCPMQRADFYASGEVPARQPDALHKAILHAAGGHCSGTLQELRVWGMDGPSLTLLQRFEALHTLCSNGVRGAIRGASVPQLQVLEIPASVLQSCATGIFPNVTSLRSSRFGWYSPTCSWKFCANRLLDSKVREVLPALTRLEAMDIPLHICSEYPGWLTPKLPQQFIPLMQQLGAASNAVDCTLRLYCVIGMRNLGLHQSLPHGSLKGWKRVHIAFGGERQHWSGGISVEWLHKQALPAVQGMLQHLSSLVELDCSFYFQSEEDTATVELEAQADKQVASISISSETEASPNGSIGNTGSAHLEPLSAALLGIVEAAPSSLETLRVVILDDVSNPWIPVHAEQHAVKHLQLLTQVAEALPSLACMQVAGMGVNEQQLVLKDGRQVTLSAWQ